MSVLIEKLLTCLFVPLFGRGLNTSSRVPVDREEITCFAPRVSHAVDGGSKAAEIFVHDEIEVVFLPGEVHVIDDTLPESSPLLIKIAAEIFDTVLVHFLQLFVLVAEFFA